jgi:hypothetical protein
MSDLIFEKRGGIAYVTFNRPERRNAISPQMMLQLADAWLEFRDDPALRRGDPHGQRQRGVLRRRRSAAADAAVHGARARRPMSGTSGC